MPEAKSTFLYSYSPEPPKKTTIKISCGIGDSDGFPAFDVESDTYASKDDSTWGFLITGGAEFHMPLTVFQVSPDGLADKAGIRLGDIILEINEEDATQLTLSQAHEKIKASNKKIHFLVKSMEEEDNLDGYEQDEERSIVLRVPKPMAPPKARSIEARLREMQRKLSEIAEIPRILSATLETVSQTYDNLMPDPVGDHHIINNSVQQNRKYSYDEDAIDYELNDDNDDGNDNKNDNETETETETEADDDKDSHDDDDDDDDEDDENDNDEDYDDGEEVVYTLSQDLHKLTLRAVKKLRNLTPESDYASSESDADDGNGDGDGDDDDGYSDNYYKNDSSGETNNNDDEDFLTTTFTWRLHKVPKLLLNDKPNENCIQKSSDEEEEEYNTMHVDKNDKEKSIENCNQNTLSIDDATDIKNEKHEKMGPLERAWPWADRTKIIYKQSTCHLVPRRPLGIVEKSKQLLAKQILFDKVQRLQTRN